MEKTLKNRACARAAVYMDVEMTDAGGCGTEIAGNCHEGKFHFQTFLDSREMRSYRKDNNLVQPIPLSESARRLLTALYLLSGIKGNTMSFETDLRELLLSIWLQARRKARTYGDVGHMGLLRRDAEKDRYSDLLKDMDLNPPESKDVYRRLLSLNEDRAGDVRSNEMRMTLNELVIDVWNAGITFQQRVAAKI